MRRDQGDDHEGPEAHARDRGCARRGRAAGGGRDRLSYEEIFDRAAPTYDVEPFPFFSPFGEALVEFAGIKPGERALDAGCGAGAALGPALRAGATAVGVELSPAMAERAREAAPGAEVRVGDAAQLDFPDGSFDVVLSSFVVFFMNDPTAALREWGRMLAPDGRLVISTWAGPDPRWAFEREVRQPYVGQADQERIRALVAGLAVLDRFTDHPKVEGELAAAGFADIEVVAHPIEFVFRDEQDWFDLNWSHGARMFLEALPPEAIEGLRSDMRNAMEQVREERGYPRTYTALFARATLA